MEDDTMHETQIQSVYNYSIDLRDSRIYSDRGFVNIDKVFQGGTHW